MSFSIDKVFLTPADMAGRKRMVKRIVEKNRDVNFAVLTKSIMSRPIDTFHV